MKQLASTISEGYPQIRVDFYEVNGCVFFGEMTLFHWGGFMQFKPEKLNYIIGDWIKLPKSKT